RTRDRLWRKGESSGHELRVREVVLDCDADAILFLPEPTGPPCNRNPRSSFDPDEPDGLADGWTAGSRDDVAPVPRDEPPDAGGTTQGVGRVGGAVCGR